MTRLPYRQAQRRRGATLVEFALVVPVFFLFIFALVDIGRGMMVSSLLTNAARVGCRTAVVPDKSTGDVKAVVDDLLKEQGIKSATVTVKVNGAAKDASTARAKDGITVGVAVPVQEVTWLPSSWFVVGQLSGQFTLMRE